jgi:hypothetical protein
MSGSLKNQVLRAARRLLSEQNRDPYQLSYGCFDRRFWSWKIVDFPEATLQRNVYCFAWILKHPELNAEFPPDILKNAITSGLSFAARIQKPDGSFDQAFPNEHSFGATAFLILPLLEAYRVIYEEAGTDFRKKIENCLNRAADFLCKSNELHGHIANHLAGAAAALFECAAFLSEPKYEDRAMDLLEDILANQSTEGWFLEYEGADPGYQTLCMYYLSKIYQLKRDEQLRTALKLAVEFIAYFVHPDGTFGGEYGSRRTAVFYPGGVALLAKEFPVARALFHCMSDAIAEGLTVTLDDIDMGNMSPLLENYVTALGIDDPSETNDVPVLPCQCEALQKDFPEAGLAIRGNAKYYAVIGISNGGTLKIFSKKDRNNVCNDGGYVGRTTNGGNITTQITDLKKERISTKDQIIIQAPFYKMSRATPTPFSFFILRFLSLTVMHSKKLCNLIKILLAGLLIRSKRTVPLHLERTIIFDKENIKINDRLRGTINLHWLESGRPFVAIHMASARYFEGSGSVFYEANKIPVEDLQFEGQIQRQVIICPEN